MECVSIELINKFPYAKQMCGTEYICYTGNKILIWIYELVICFPNTILWSYDVISMECCLVDYD